MESGVLGTPTFSQTFQNASTGVIPSDQLTDSQGDPIVYQLLAVDENGDVCSMTITQVRFFRFDGELSSYRLSNSSLSNSSPNELCTPLSTIIQAVTVDLV